MNENKWPLGGAGVTGEANCGTAGTVMFLMGMSCYVYSIAVAVQRRKVLNTSTKNKNQINKDALEVITVRKEQAVE